KLDRPMDREHPCCRNISTIRKGKGPHVGELRCADCNQHRDWLSFEVACMVFGLPQAPIVVHELHKGVEAAAGSAQEQQRRLYEIRQRIKRGGFELKDFFLSSPPLRDFWREQQRHKIEQLMFRYGISAHDLTELPSDVGAVGGM